EGDLLGNRLMLGNKAGSFIYKILPFSFFVPQTKEINFDLDLKINCNNIKTIVLIYCDVWAL
ncbi:MAG: hypothetical protein WAM16_02850, partial [Nitrososphaeraceae archaeon]